MNDCSDHFAPFIWFPRQLQNNNQIHNRKLSFRNWKSLDCEEFSSFLRSELTNFTIEKDLDSNSNTLNFISILSKSLDKFCPITHRKPLKTAYKPWLTQDLKNLVKEKNKLYKKYLNKPLTYGSQYRKLRNHVNNCIKLRKNKYYQDSLTKCGNNSKKTWSILNELLGRSKRGGSISLNIGENLS